MYICDKWKQGPDSVDYQISEYLHNPWPHIVHISNGQRCKKQEVDMGFHDLEDDYGITVQFLPDTLGDTQNDA